MKEKQVNIQGMKREPHKDDHTTLLRAKRRYYHPFGKKKKIPKQNP